MNDSASLGDTIRDRRLALGYSLGQLATKVNKTASSIRAWERGDALPSDAESEELATALDLDAALLASLREPAKVWQPEEVEELDVHDPWPEGDERTSDDETEPAAAGATTKPAASADAAGESVPEAPTDEPDGKEAPAEAVAEPAEDALTAAGDAADSLSEEPVATPDGDPDAEEHSELFEAKTEAVPVVPPTTVAVAQPQTDPVLSATTARPVEPRSDNPVVAAWDDLRALYYRIFDPRRRWIYRVRFVLVLIALFIMLRALAWAAGNLFDAIGEVLDSISFSPGETPDVEN